MSLRNDVRSVLSGSKIDPLEKIAAESLDGFLPLQMREICYGIEYALTTGRLPGKVDYAIRHLKPQQVGKLVCDLYDDGINVSGEVPRVLIKRFA